MWTAVLLLACAASAASGGKAPPSAELHKRSVSELRALLDARGVTCKACTAKKHWVARVRKTWSKPIVKAAQRKGGKKGGRRRGGGGKRNRNKKTQRRKADIEVQDDGHGGYALSKEVFMEQLAQNEGIDAGMMEQLWGQFNSQVESGEISLDPKKSLGVKQSLNMKQAAGASGKGVSGAGENDSTLEYMVRVLTAEGSLFHFATYTWTGRAMYVLVVLTFMSSGRRRCKRDGCLRCCCPMVRICDWFCSTGRYAPAGTTAALESDGRIGGSGHAKAE